MEIGIEGKYIGVHSSARPPVGRRGATHYDDLLIDLTSFYALIILSSSGKHSEHNWTTLVGLIVGSKKVK